jgi:prepilin-type N-terminal cleavage/methylation domain-containing protein
MTDALSDRRVARGARGGSPAGQGGSTLVELLAVIAILALLGGLVYLWLDSKPDDAEAAACQSELDVVRSAVQAANSADHAADLGATPAQYVDRTTRYYAWSGSPGSWVVRAVGTIPFGC